MVIPIRLVQEKTFINQSKFLTKTTHCHLPSGALFDVATMTTPFENSSVNKRLKIIASAMSVT